MKYKEEELEKWWVAFCPRCGWEGLSRDCAGGGQIVGSSDFEDPLCPICIKDDVYVILDDKNYS